MSIKNIIIATVVIAIVGLLIAIILSIAEKAFHVDVDEREILVRDCLAGSNCGGCGYAGCDALAKAIVKGEASVSACAAAGKSGADKIAEIMGVSAGEFVKKVAFVKCAGSCENRNQQYTYYGQNSCKALKVAPGDGIKSCRYGCYGFGTCAEVCDNKAIRIVHGVAVVDEELCIACGKCVKACPQKLIELVPADSKYRVHCSNQQRGKVVKDNCSKGCIGCSLCAKNCENDAVIFENNIAKIDYEKCIQCGKCAEKCPTKTIH